MTSLFKKVLLMALTIGTSTLINKTMAQAVDPITNPAVESHVKGFLKAVNAATTIPVSEMPIDHARGTYT
jgi:hypothetical protein